MAPSRKTKSDPRRTSENLIKALKKNKADVKKKTEDPKMSKAVKSTPVKNKTEERKMSKPIQPEPMKNKTEELKIKAGALEKNKAVSEPVKEKPVESCLRNSSPESVKKNGISKNLKSKLSKKRKRVEETATKQEGLKLLKRGAVTMHRIVRRKMLGIKLEVLFNKKGEPYGDAAKEMQSYIGVLARTKAPIWYDSWLRVPVERKNKIWDCVQVKEVASTKPTKNFTCVKL